ncbi:MAG: hypothetical protein HQL86_04865 [Magnetococcales bacterium]|nr:hypothetical protein [Magnetococcales bacterium]
MAHRYWRLLVTQSTNGTRGWITLAEIQMRLSGGSESLCGQGTASASHNDADAALLFDSDDNTSWSNDAPGVASWIAYDFGAGQAVAVGSLWILPVFFDQAPRDMRCQWSDDAVVWHDQGVWSDLTEWVDWEWRTFTLPERTPCQDAHGQGWQSRLESGSIQPLQDTLALAMHGIWSLRQRHASRLVQPRADSETCSTCLGQGFGMLTHDPVQVALGSWWRLRASDTPHLASWPDVTLDGRTLPIESATLSWSPDQVAWRARLLLAQEALLPELSLEQRVTLGWDGVTFRMLVIDQGLTLAGSGGLEQELDLLGVAARHGEPFAASRAWSWERPVTARAAVEEALGEGVIWQLPDWLLPAFRLRLEQETPLGVARQIVQAVGGQLRSRADGVLEMVPRHPCPLPEWCHATPAHELDVDAELLESRETGIRGTRINRVTVRAEADELQKPGIWLEVDPLASTTDTQAPDQTVRILALVSPGVHLDTLTSSSGTWMPAEGVMRSRSELLRFENNNRVVLSRPAWRIESVIWMGEDLGLLTLEPDGRTVTAARAGSALAQVVVTLAVAGCHPLKSPASVAEGNRFSTLVVARGVVRESPGEAVVLTRGHPPWRDREIASRLLTDTHARRARAVAELDDGELLRSVRLTVMHRPRILPGELIEVRDGRQGGGYRAEVHGVTHEIDASGARTRLEVGRRAW